MTPQVLTAVDRSGLIDDAFALARYLMHAWLCSYGMKSITFIDSGFLITSLFSSGYPNIQIDTPLQLVQHLGSAHEKSYVPWSTAISWLRRIGMQLQYTPVFGEFKVCYILHT